MVSFRSQVFLLIGVFIFVLLHNLLRIYTQSLEPETLFYQVLLYAQYAVYGGLFCIGSTYFLKQRIAYKKRVCPTQKINFYHKHFLRARLVHMLAYGYLIVVLISFILFRDADRERPYHFIFYFLSTVSVSIWFSKIEQNEAFAMDR